MIIRILDITGQVKSLKLIPSVSFSFFIVAARKFKLRMWLTFGP